MEIIAYLADDVLIGHFSPNTLKYLIFYFFSLSTYYDEQNESNIFPIG